MTACSRLTAVALVLAAYRDRQRRARRCDVPCEESIVGTHEIARGDAPPKLALDPLTANLAHARSAAGIVHQSLNRGCERRFVVRGHVNRRLGGGPPRF